MPTEFHDYRSMKIKNSFNIQLASSAVSFKQTLDAAVDALPVDGVSFAKGKSSNPLFSLVHRCCLSDWPGHVNDSSILSHLHIEIEPCFQATQRIDSAQRLRHARLTCHHSESDAANSTVGGAARQPPRFRRYEDIRSRFWWLGLDIDIERHVGQCVPCAQNGRNPPETLIALWKLTDRPWQHLHPTRRNFMRQRATVHIS